MVPHVYIIIMLFFSAPGGERQEETQEKEIHQLRDGESELGDKSGPLDAYTLPNSQSRWQGQKVGVDEKHVNISVSESVAYS